MGSEINLPEAEHKLLAQRIEEITSPYALGTGQK
jgi:hypothetical protein